MSWVVVHVCVCLLLKDPAHAAVLTLLLAKGAQACSFFSRPPARNMNPAEGEEANPDHIEWGIGALDVTPSKKAWRCEDDGNAAAKTKRRNVSESLSSDELPINETAAQTLRHEEVLYSPDWPRKQLPEYPDDPWLNPEYHHSLGGIDPHSPFKFQNFLI